MKAKIIIWSWITSWILLFIGADLVDPFPVVGYSSIGLFFIVNIVFITNQRNPDVVREADKISRKFNKIPTMNRDKRQQIESIIDMLEQINKEVIELHHGEHKVGLPTEALDSAIKSMQTTVEHLQKATK